MENGDSKIPACIGIIMDGNRRWAREHNLPTLEGHKRGYDKAQEAAGWCRDAGVKYLILYAFSNENWNRSPEEVAYLTEIFKTIVFDEAEEMRKENGAIRFIGDIARFGEDFEAQAKHLEAANPAEPSLTVVIALSYGGRQEIVRAVNELLKEKKIGEVTEADVAAHLYTRGIPDPDLILRTSGEQRLSNFLPWQATYSELFFVPMHWPEFSKEDFENVLKEYATRERRRGK
jgi:undecaprenyl diphosphate synthase